MDMNAMDRRMDKEGDGQMDKCGWIMARQMDKEGMYR
jgi:hypothetical protein